MRNLLDEVVELLQTDKNISQIFANNIWLTEYPEPNSMHTPYIVIDEIDEPLPAEHGSNRRLSLSYIIQVDVFVPSSRQYNAFNMCRDMSYKISELLYEILSLKNTASSKPEYDNEYRLYRRARRYEGVYYLGGQ